jgi:hypothetical protein
MTLQILDSLNNRIMIKIPGGSFRSGIALGIIPTPL